MLSLLRKLSLGPEAPLRMEDPDFGAIRFLESSGKDGYWAMDGKWTVPYQAQGITCAEIPGDRSGPATGARSFLLSKRSQADDIWDLAAPHLRELMAAWSHLEALEPKKAFFISCLAKDSDLQDGWEVCFETHEGLEWVNFCLQMEGDDVVSNTIYT